MENTIKMELPEPLQQATLQMVKDAINSVVAENKQANDYPFYMNQRQASKYLNIAPATLSKWEKSKKDLPVISIEGVRRYRRDDLDKWMKSQKK